MPDVDRDALFRAIVERNRTERPDDEGFEHVQRGAESFARGVMGTGSLLLEGPGIAASGAGQALQNVAERSKMLSFLDPVGKHMRLAGELARDAGQAVREFSEETRSMPGRGGFLTEDVATGLGSAAPFLATGGLAGAAGLGAKGVMALTATQGALVNGASEFLDAEYSGATEEQKWKSFLVGSAVGTTEAVPLGGMANRLAGIDRRTGGALRRVVDVLIEGGEEAAQEAFQQLSSNLIASEIRDEDRDAFQGMIDSGAAGGASGIILSMLIPGKQVTQTLPEAVETLVGPEEAEAQKREIAREEAEERAAEPAVPEGVPARNIREVIPAEGRIEGAERAGVTVLPSEGPGEAVGGAGRRAEKDPTAPGVEAQPDQSQPQRRLAPETGDGTRAPLVEEQISEETLEAASKPTAEGAEGTDVLLSGIMPLFKTPSLSTMIDSAKSFVGRNFRSRGDLPTPAFARKIDRDSRFQGALEETRLAVRDFDGEVRKVFGQKPSQEDIRYIDRVFKGQEEVSTLPKELQSLVTQMREHVDRLSQLMMAEGVIEGPMAARVADNLGFYATRTYKVFEDPKWAQKVPVDVRNKAKAFLRAEQGITESEADTLIEQLLHSGKAADNPIAFLAKGKLGSKDLSITKRRKGIPLEIRELFGENVNARTNYANSIIKMASLIENHRFLKDVRKEGMGTFFYEADDLKRPKEFKAQIAAEGSDTLAPLNGLMTTPEIKQAFEDFAGTNTAPQAWLRAWLKVNGFSKLAKTNLSLMTHVRNVTGNVGFAVANGHWNAAHSGKAFKTVMASFGSKKLLPYRELWLEAVRLGVVQESTNAGEVRDIAKDAGLQTPEEFLQENTKRNLKKGLIEGPSRLYQAEDDVWKLYAWFNETARYRKALPDKSETEIKKMAAEIVRNTYPTYSLVPRAIKALRRFPLAGTFVSFPAEVIRVGGHTLSQAAKEMKSKNPKVQSIGRQRALGLLLAASIPSAVATGLRMMIGMTADEEEDARIFLPPWSQNSNIMWLGLNSRGQRRYIDASYTDPWSYLKDPARALLRGEDWKGALYGSLSELLDPFISEEIMTQAAVDIRRNKKPTGGPVFNEADEWDKQAIDIASHLWKGLEPGTLSSMKRIQRGLDGEVTLYSRAYDAKIEALALFTGTRLSTVDLRSGVQFKGLDYARTQADTTRGMGAVLRNTGEVSDEEIAEAYEGAERQRRKAFDELRAAVNAARALGLTTEQVESALDGVVSKKIASNVLAGKYEPYVPASSYMASTIKKAPETLREELRRRVGVLKQTARDAQASEVAREQ